MTSVSVPKNTYMLWLKENRDNIKQMYFSNYIPKNNADGKKENLQCVLTKKAGEIWSSLDSDTREVYNIKLKKLKESNIETISEDNNSSSETLKKLAEQKIFIFNPNDIDYDKKQIYCPNKCGAIRRTLEGLYSHLGLKENAADNCTKKPHIIKTKSYKKALEKLYSEPNTTIDFSQYIKSESPPPYEDKPNVQPKRKSIPKAVKNSVWNKYIETDDPKKLIGKCFVGCGCEITIANFEVGHVNAYSNGGSDKVENLRPICSTCNKSMGTMNLLEFKDLYGLNSKK